MDDSAEDEWWKPHGVTFPPGREYPLTKAHSISCFTQMCRLSVIFHEILIHIYDPVQSKSEYEVEECIHREGAAMLQWWQDLPTFLKIDALILPDFSPPSHIVTLKSVSTFNIKQELTFSARSTTLSRSFFTDRCSFDAPTTRVRLLLLTHLISKSA